MHYRSLKISRDVRKEFTVLWNCSSLGSSVVWIDFMQVSAHKMPGPGWHQEPLSIPLRTARLWTWCVMIHFFLATCASHSWPAAVPLGTAVYLWKAPTLTLVSNPNSGGSFSHDWRVLFYLLEPQQALLWNKDNPEPLSWEWRIFPHWRLIHPSDLSSFDASIENTSWAFLIRPKSSSVYTFLPFVLPLTLGISYFYYYWSVSVFFPRLAPLG